MSCLFVEYFNELNVLMKSYTPLFRYFLWDMTSSLYQWSSAKLHCQYTGVTAALH